MKRTVLSQGCISRRNHDSYACYINTFCTQLGGQFGATDSIWIDFNTVPTELQGGQSTLQGGQDTGVACGACNRARAISGRPGFCVKQGRLQGSGLPGDTKHKDPVRDTHRMKRTVLSQGCISRRNNDSYACMLYHYFLHLARGPVLGDRFDLDRFQCCAHGAAGWPEYPARRQPSYGCSLWGLYAGPGSGLWIRC